ncbi:MAG: hypothetical protein GFGODING_00429 [Flavobacteriales bacterium]|nr:hypothetical protein [Flavobacteriales bacterium]
MRCGGAVAISGPLAARTAAAMNTFLRKHHTSLLTFGIYLALTAFALLVSLGQL